MGMGFGADTPRYSTGPATPPRQGDEKVGTESCRGMGMAGK